MLKFISRLCLVCLIPAFAFSAAAAESRIEPLYTPPPIQVPDGRTPEQVLCIVRTALVALGWEVVMKSSNQIEATIRPRRHVGVVDVRFDTQAVAIQYVDSQELEYRIDGEQRYIHRGFNGWVSNLERAIKAGLQQSVAGQ